MIQIQERNMTRALSACLALLLSLGAFAYCSRDPGARSSGEEETAVSPEALPSETVPDEAPAPRSSDTAAFVDSTAAFRLRTDRRKADPDEMGLTLCWDGVELPRAGGLYFLPVEADFPAADLLKLSAETDGEDMTVYIDSHLLDIGLSPLLAHNTRADLCCCSEERYVVLELCFTTLPVAAADVKRSSLSGNDRKCSFSLWEMKNGRLRKTDSPATLRIRGASSASLAKTGLKLSLKDAEGEPNKVSLLGMRKDDDWVLYASYSDNAHVRDAVGWNLWRKMTENAGLEPSGALETRWVELILGGKYDGFYLMMEPMDQKTLGLDAARGDCLFKCKSWDVPESAALRRQSARAVIWSSLEKKYPDPKNDAENINGKADWAKIADFVAVCYETSGEEFTAQAESILDTKQILEYWLFLNLSMAADNTWKNTYYAVTDGKVRAYPWDLDITFGLGWNGDPANNYLWEQPGMDTRTYDLQAGRRLIKYVKGCADYVRERYETLKEAGICSADALIADAEEQWAILHGSGAWQRNLERWPSVSTTDSLDYFKSTVRTHEAWFEEYLASLP